MISFLFVCISAYANVYFKTILRECLRAGLPSGFPSTAPPPVCVSAILGMLAVYTQGAISGCCTTILSWDSLRLDSSSAGL